MSVNSCVSKCISAASKGRLGLRCSPSKGDQGERPGSFWVLCAHLSVGDASHEASTKLPPFPRLYFHTAEHKIGSKRSVAKRSFLHVLSLFREWNFPKNSQHVSPYMLLVRTGSHVSPWQRGQSSFVVTGLDQSWFLNRAWKWGTAME